MNKTHCIRASAGILSCWGHFVPISSKENKMEVSRRSIAKALPVGIVAALTAPAIANATPDVPTAEQMRVYKRLERGFKELGAMSDSDVVQLAQQIQDKRNQPTTYVSLPGVAGIISCILNALWIFRQGTDKNRIIGQLTDVVVGCIGIPLGTTLTLKLSRMIWDNRQKIIAALSAAGLTVSQLAPLQNAPRP